MLKSLQDHRRWIPIDVNGARESASIERFIRGRQFVLMQRAIAAIAVADDSDLQYQFHRLAGSLGTYRLHTAAELLYRLEERARVHAEQASSLDGLRSEALSGLRAIASTIEAVA